MNINDFQAPAVPQNGQDMLRMIFERQKELMEKYEPIERANGFHVPSVPADLHFNKDQVYIKDMMWRVTEEMGEAANCLKNKPWKQTHMLTDVDHFQEELIDGFHFYVELLIIAGIDAEKLYEIYFRKSEVNKFRQASQY